MNALRLELCGKGWTIKTNPWFVAQRFGTREVGSNDLVTIAIVHPLSQDQLAFLSTWTDSILDWLEEWERLANRPPLSPSLSTVRRPEGLDAPAFAWLMKSPLIDLVPLYSLMWGGSRRLLLVAACRSIPAILELPDDELSVLYAELMRAASLSHIDILAWLLNRLLPQ